VGVGW